MNDEFKQLIYGSFKRDEDYEACLNLWFEYRRQTDHLPASKNQECLKIHRKLFEGIPRDEKYQRAKLESARKYRETPSDTERGEK